MRTYRVIEMYRCGYDEYIMTEAACELRFGYVLWQKILAGMFENLYQVTEV